MLYLLEEEERGILRMFGVQSLKVGGWNGSDVLFGCRWLFGRRTVVFMNRKKSTSAPCMPEALAIFYLLYSRTKLDDFSVFLLTLLLSHDFLTNSTPSFLIILVPKYN